MTTKSIKYLFLEHLTLGQKVNIKNPIKVIDKCVRLAWRDMLSAGRYYKLDKNIIVKYKEILKRNNYNNPAVIRNESLNLFGDQEKIYMQRNSEKFATRFGLCQKLVNMTFKYFFVFNDYTKLNINYSQCDCPLDRKILNKINYTDTVWSKLTKEEYSKCQNKIAEKLSKVILTDELKTLNNLAFDFINW